MAASIVVEETLRRYCGITGKITTSIALGVPVVTTVGVEGMDLDRRRGVLAQIVGLRPLGPTPPPGSRR